MSKTNTRSVAMAIVMVLLFTGAAYAQGVINPDPKPVDNNIHVEYTPPGQIKWVLESSQGDEIIDIDELAYNLWRFDITPDTKKLSLSDRQQYPLEIYRLIDPGTDAVKPVKQPLDPRSLYIRNFPLDSRITPIREIPPEKIGYTDYKIDLTENRGVTLLADPDILSGAYVKYGPHSATYSAVSNVITVTGSPVTSLFQSTYDALYGVAPGTPITKCGSRCFCLSARLDIGDGGTTDTNVSDSGCTVHFTPAVIGTNQSVIYVNDAHVTFGEIKNATYKTTENGVTIVDENLSDSEHYLITAPNAYDYINAYSTSFRRLYDETNDRSRLNVKDTSNFWNCDFQRVYLQYIGNLGHCDISGCRFDYNVVGGFLGPHSDTSISDTYVFATRGVYLNINGTFTFSNCVFRDNNEVISVWNNDIDFYLINNTISDYNEFIDWHGAEGSIGAGTTEVYEQYTVDLLVTSQSGTPVNGVPITISNTFGTPVFSSLILSGTIPTQTLSKLMYTQTDGGSTTYSPYTITIDETIDYQGYQGMFELDRQKYFEISLLPQIESGTTAGDVIDWLQTNDATISWWEDNMDTLTGVLFVLVVVAMALWIRQWWMLIFSGMCSIGWGGIMYEDGLSYGVPFFVLGMLLLGYMAKLELSRYTNSRR